MATYIYECPQHGRAEVVKPMAEAGRLEFCDGCAESFRENKYRGAIAPFPHGPMRRIFTPPQRAIVRPSGYRLSPDDPKYGDFRRELALGELKEDPTPLKFSAAELASFDHVDVTVPDDPERDRQLAQLVHQHWTNDLSDDTVRRRELETQALQEGKL